MNYLAELKENDQTEYQKIMTEILFLDYGVPLGPKSFAGKIYKYNCGVIGIDENGNKEEINMDETKDNHSSATIKIGCRLNEKFNIKYGKGKILITTYDSGTILSYYGILVIQLEGDSMYVYLPNKNLTDVQKELLQEEIDAREGNFNIVYARNGKVLENFSLQSKKL